MLYVLLIYLTVTLANGRITLKIVDDDKFLGAIDGNLQPTDYKSAISIKLNPAEDVSKKNLEGSDGQAVTESGSAWTFFLPKRYRMEQNKKSSKQEFRIVYYAPNEYLLMRGDRCLGFVESHLKRVECKLGEAARFRICNSELCNSYMEIHQELMCIKKFLIGQAGKRRRRRTREEESHARHHKKYSEGGRGNRANGDNGNGDNRDGNGNGDKDEKGNGRGQGNEGRGYSEAENMDLCGFAAKLSSRSSENESTERGRHGYGGRYRDRHDDRDRDRYYGNRYDDRYKYPRYDDRYSDRYDDRYRHPRYDRPYEDSPGSYGFRECKKDCAQGCKGIYGRGNYGGLAGVLSGNHLIGMGMCRP